MNPQVYQSDSRQPFGARVRAILMDVDGTMYDHAALRRKVLAGLCREHALCPLAGWRTLRALQEYRWALERLRYRDAPSADLENLQVDMVCLRTGYTSEFVHACVRRWMEEEPLKHLPLCADPGLKDLLEHARESQIALAVCSDYPAHAKLESLGIRHYFQGVISAKDPEVRRFKPHPRMLEVALEALQVSAAEALFLGDRPEVDGVAAANAGMPYVNIVHRARHASSMTFRQVITALKT